MFQLRSLLVLSLVINTCFLFTGLVSAQNAAEKTALNKYREMKLQKHKGLVRLGAQDTSGFYRPGVHGSINRSHINANKNDSKRVAQQIEDHNYSLGLMSRFRFMNNYPECFKNLKGYKKRVESCNGLAIRHDQQIEFWKKLVETMAFSLKTDHHALAFCMGEPECFTRQATDLYKPAANGGKIQLDEFEERDFVNNLMRKEYKDFENYWPTQSFPKEAYLVKIVNLGDYDFDSEKFAFDLTGITSFYSQNISTGNFNNTMNSRLMSAPAVYTPTLNFEDKTKSNYGGGLRAKVDVPMTSAKARKVIKGTNGLRQVYAVVRIRMKLTDKNAEIGGQLVRGLSSPVTQYHYAENKVELFKDEALTQKIAEVPIVDKVENDDGGQDSGTKYEMDDDSYLLDYRTMAFLRIKEADLLQRDLDQIAYSLPIAEKGFWIELKSRQDRANKPIQSTSNKSAQETLQNAKKSDIDRAKYTNISWQDINELSPAQQKAFYGFVTANGPIKDDQIIWPESLTTIPWGMNIASVFRKGYFSNKTKDKMVPVESDTKKLIQDFLRDVGNSMTINNLALVYELQDVYYDYKTKKLIVNKNGVPLARATNVEYFDSNNKAYKDKTYKGRTAQVAVSKAKNRLLYKFRPSNRGLGGKKPNAPHRQCVNNRKTKSTDCTTSHSNFTQMTFPSTFLALDREIALTNISMDKEKGQALTTNNAHPGFRFVVELENVDMELIQYNYNNNKTKKEGVGEGQTLFANVKRVLVLAANNDIVWSQDGSDLNRSSDIIKVKADKKAADAKARTDSANAAAQVEAARIAEVAKKTMERQEQNKKTQQKKTQVRQCNVEYRTKKRAFDKCETIRQGILKSQTNLENAKEKGCKSTDEDDEPNSTKNRCDFPGNMPITELSNKMKSCMADVCGTTPATMDEMKEYQLCAKDIGEELKAAMSKAMGLGSKRKLRKPRVVDNCKSHQNKIDNFKKRKKRYQCGQHTAQPEKIDCSKS